MFIYTNMLFVHGSRRRPVYVYIYTAMEHLLYCMYALENCPGKRTNDNKAKLKEREEKKITKQHRILPMSSRRAGLMSLLAITRRCFPNEFIHTGATQNGNDNWEDYRRKKSGEIGRKEIERKR